MGGKHVDLTIDQAVTILVGLMSDEGQCDTTYDQGAAEALAEALGLLDGENDAPAALKSLAWAIRTRDRRVRSASFNV